MRTIQYKSLKWWTWAVIGALLLWGLTGETRAREAAMAIGVAQALVFLVVHRSLRHFGTQLRWVYALWMAVSFVPELYLLYWIQTAGTAALVFTGYCPLARMLLLFPWNRRVPLTWRRVCIIAFHPPVPGSVATGLPMRLPRRSRVTLDVKDQDHRGGDN